MFTAVVIPPGRPAFELTPVSRSVRFSSAAVGGFGAASFTVEGDEAMRASRIVPFLSTVRIMFGSVMLWEGRIEDRRLRIAGDSRSCFVQCFGYRRLLEDTSIKRIWSTRSIPWQPAVPVSGIDTVNGTTPSLRTDTMSVVVGQTDPGDLSRTGIRVDNYSGTSGATGFANWALYRLPSGITLVKAYVETWNLAGSRVFIQDSVTGSSWDTRYDADPTITATEQTVTFNSGATRLIAGSMCPGAGLGNQGALEQWRILCTSLDESASGGFYGGRILADLLALVAGLTTGIIDLGSDFTIPSIGRPLRDSALSIVEEVAAFYSREWSVWEDAKFNWIAPNLEEPQWVIPTSDCSVFEIEQSVSGLVRTSYILYEDAASGIPGEATAVATDQRNPFVKSGVTKDELLQAPVVMTSAGASQLATLTAADRGKFPVARGDITLPATKQVAHANGGSRPAMQIRAGENVVVPDAPSDFPSVAGRDGQTLFHVVSSETDMRSEVTKLTLDGYARTGDVLMARLAALTRAVTG